MSTRTPNLRLPAALLLLVVTSCATPPTVTEPARQPPPVVAEAQPSEPPAPAPLAPAPPAPSPLARAPRSGPAPQPEPGEPKLYTLSEAEVEAAIRAAADRFTEPADRAVYLARRNLGQPYEIYLLGEFPFEFYDPDPIYNLRRSDCLTFCEHMYAMALSRDWWGFLSALQRLRYRDGQVGMLTRNHWTVGWWNPANAYLFEDLTERLAGGRACVPMNKLIRPAAFFRQFNLGQDLPDERMTSAYIPTERVPDILGELRDGDFVNIIRGDDRLQWAGHTGLIAIGPDDSVNFLHSVSPHVREEPLVDYLRADQARGSGRGVKILRLRPDAEARMRSALASASATPISAESLHLALLRTPLMPTGAPDSYFDDWKQAMDLQAYRLETDTPCDAELEAALRKLDVSVATDLDMLEADRAIGLLDVATRRFVALHPDKQFYGASVPKLAIVMGYFDKFPQAADELDEQVARELELVLKRSDNELAAKYSQLVGLDHLQKMLTSSRYRFYDQRHGGGIWCGKHYGVDQPRIGDPLDDHSHAVTVRQCLRFYLMLEQGRLVSGPASAWIKTLMAAPRLEFHNQSFVRGLIGRDVAVIRKSGTWEDWHLDTARVQGADRWYLLAGATKHPRGSEYLARMAAEIDDLLGGHDDTGRPPCEHHRLIRHETAADFGPGAADGEGWPVLTLGGAGATATYESPVLTAERPFNEVVASCNIDAADAVGWVLQLRVGRLWDDAWSPWLSVLEWGDVPAEAEWVGEFDGGRIDTDYFTSERLYDRVQYRLVAGASADEPTTARIRRVALVLSDRTRVPFSIWSPAPTVEPPPPADWQRELPVPFRAQATPDPTLSGRLCSPASVAMVLAYRGVDVDTYEVVKRCLDPRHNIYGNWPRNVQAAYSFGVPGYLTRISDWATVERYIADDQPLVISIRVPNEGDLRNAPYRTTAGHLIVITGFTPDGMVLVNDPSVSSKEKSRFALYREDLENVWMRARGGLAYVLMPREDHGSAAP